MLMNQKDELGLMPGSRGLSLVMVQLGVKIVHPQNMIADMFGGSFGIPGNNTFKNSFMFL